MKDEQSPRSEDLPMNGSAGTRERKKVRGARREDIRHRCDGVRVQSLLGEMLAQGGREFRSKYAKLKVTNIEFARSALPYLYDHGLVRRIEARIELPPDLSPSHVELVKRDGGSAIWFPTQELVDRWLDIWTELDPQFRDGKIIWPDDR
jgi:hypothetical protein